MFSKLDEAKNISDIFWEDGSIYVDGTSEEVAIFKGKLSKIPNCFWLEAEEVIEDTKSYYRRYTPDNECNRLYANIAQSLTGKQPPKIPERLRHHGILNDEFCKNLETGVFINNAHLFKKHTLECFLADGKYFHENPLNRKLVSTEDNLMKFEYEFKAYLVVVVPPETQLPPMAGSIINHVDVCHLKNLIGQ